MSNLDLSPDQWVKLLTGDDLQCMLVIGFLTYVLFRVKIPEWLCFIAPVVAGGVWGAWNAVDQQWAFGAHILKGFYVNGAGAALAAFAVHKATEKLSGSTKGAAAIEWTFVSAVLVLLAVTVVALVAALALFGCGSDEHDYRGCVFAGDGSTCCYTDCSDDGRKCETVCD